MFTRSAFLEAYTRTDDLSPFRSSVTLRSSDFELCSFKTARPLHAQKVLDGNITFRWEEVFNHTMPKISSKAACLQLLVPKSMVLAFQRKDITDRSQNLYLAKVYDEDKMMWIQLNDFARGIRVYSIQNRVTVLIRGLKEKFQASEEKNLLSFTLSFQAVPACASLQLEVKCPTDHATGYTVCVSRSVCLPACLPAYLPACLSACLSYLPACLSACLSACLPVCLSVLSACLSICLPACLSACLPVCLCLSVCLPACLPACTLQVKCPTDNALG